MGNANTRSGLPAGFRLAPVLLAAFLWLPHLAGAQGQTPDAAQAAGAVDYDRPNPHAGLECKECHGEKPPDDATAETVKFANGEEGNVKLCNTCHEPFDNFHAVEVDPFGGTPRKRLPKDFPVERFGVNQGTVVCSTCHYIHGKTAGFKLLRGFPVSSDPTAVAGARYKVRREFCQGCHGENLAKQSPHKGKVAADAKAMQNCAFCHAKEPKQGEAAQLRQVPAELCDACHAATKADHFRLVDPFSDPALAEQVKAAPLPLFKGERTCVTCHDPHGGIAGERSLRKEFVALALQSRRVKPHFVPVLCEACHTVRPKFPKGDPGAQKLAEIPLRSQDMNVLCNRCHDSGFIRENDHPIKKAEGKYLERLPKDWPLQEGGLTCLTCHTPGDSPTVDPKNASFLRGGPYETRNTMCWTCHLQEEFRATNPHEEVNEGKGCTSCHPTKPDQEQQNDPAKMKFKGDIVLLCIRCHEDNPHPGNHDHTGAPDPEVVKKNNIQLPKDFPLDSLGRLTCATCHNPHAGGDQRGIVVGMEICSQCHQF